MRPTELNPVLDFEERALALVLAVLGLLGVALGLLSPRDHPTELVLGALLVMAGAWTFASDRRHVSR